MAGGRGPPRPGHYSRAPGGEQPLPGLLREDPRLYVFAEEAIKAQVQKRVGRGKVDVFVSIDSSAADKVEVTLNRPVADGYYAALTQMRDTYSLRDDISVSLLSRFP